jgi:type I restriction enzyme M protein
VLSIKEKDNRIAQQLPLEADAKLSAVIVQQGKVLDLIDGITQREETPEEYVRQEIAKSLVREYSYPKRDISVEFTLRVGSQNRAPT